MAPRFAAERFLAEHPRASRYRVTLFGALAATGRGHLTDVVLEEAFAGREMQIVWRPEERLARHPNGMLFEGIDDHDRTFASWQAYSVGGGAVMSDDDDEERERPYPHRTMRGVMGACEDAGRAFWEYVLEAEGSGIEEFLRDIWQAMSASVTRGLQAEGVLPGGLGVSRKAWSMRRKAETTGERSRRTALLSAYALAVAEENASGGVVVTAPTCGSSGIVPSVLTYISGAISTTEGDLCRALATAGLIGNLVKANASISGASVGCQGEVGTACAMAAGAAVQLLGGSNRQVEYAAEMGLEHHLGLTCDPIGGLVQIPCIERNAMAATRAMTCADYALLSDGGHRVAFDEAVEAMNQTGHDLPSLYRETGGGGLAAAHRTRPV